MIRSYLDVQFSVHNDGLFGEFGPAKVSPHLNPLHALICMFNLSNENTNQKRKRSIMNRRNKESIFK